MKIIIFGLLGQVGSIFFKNKIDGYYFISSPYKSIDMFEKDIVKNFVIKNNPDVVLNLAAYTDVDGCEVDKDKAFNLNAYFPREISKACEKTGSLLIHLSTDYVYNDVGEKLINEKLKPNPKSIYGKSKYLGEKYIVDNCSKYIILRSSWIYSDIGKNFYLTIKNLLKDKNNINVVNDQFGAPTLAYDLVMGIYEIIKFMNNKKNQNTDLHKYYGTYNISNTGSVSWFEFANMIARTLSHIPSEKINPINTRDFGALAHRPINSRLDNSKLYNTFGVTLPLWEDSFYTFSNKLKI